MSYRMIFLLEGPGLFLRRQSLYDTDPDAQGHGDLDLAHAPLTKSKDAAFDFRCHGSRPSRFPCALARCKPALTRS